ncbi:hypothetical protein BGW37DRAFT_419827 [Umbelopsis sp. PMI_123]|nr:hypothetical protein BGW37DRAFT_419827 [Umbelopsis sp. PMI_123]
MSTANRTSRRETARQAAYTFLSNINLGSETDRSQARNGGSENTDAIADSSGQLSGPTSANLSANETNATSLLSKQLESRSDTFVNHNYGGPYGRRNKSDNFEDNDGHHRKLTREDNSKPIASEKIKKKHVEREQHTGLGILSAFRYYSEKIRQSAIKRKADATPNTGYVQQQIANHDHQRRRPAQSFGHFLDPCGSLQPEHIVQEQLSPSAYDPYFLENDLYSPERIKAGDVKRELNEMFRSEHPEIPQEITLSKLRSIKSHLLEIGKELDLEVSSVAHAYVYFEKLVIKNIITKKNRKLIAGCCLFLAVKVNEPKGSKLQPLLDAIDDELDIDSEEILEHEFAVFADLEFNLYVPRREFMPHFVRICSDLGMYHTNSPIHLMSLPPTPVFFISEMRSMEAYLGDADFFAIDTK